MLAVAGGPPVGHGHEEARVRSAVVLHAVVVKCWIEHAMEQGLGSHGAADEVMVLLERTMFSCTRSIGSVGGCRGTIFKLLYRYAVQVTRSLI